MTAIFISGSIDIVDIAMAMVNTKTSSERGNSMKKFLGLKKISATILAAVALFSGVSTVNADTGKYCGTNGYEYAVFPNSTVYVSQTAYGDYSHSGKNVTDIVPDGRLVAPFSGTIRYIDKSWGYVILESDNKVNWADGTVDKLCVGFMHDNDISDLWVGKHINQGEAFYDKGTKAGSGGSKITGAHVHVIVMAGAFQDTFKSKYSTRGNVYIYNAFYLAPGTSISKSGYAKSNWKYLPDQGSVSQPAPVLRVTTAFNAPTTLKKGKSFGLRGIITADVGTITNVTAYVKGANGNAYYYNVNPSCKTWNAQNTINNSFLFGKLSKGNYTYYVSVTATNGGMCTNYTFSRDFKVT